MRLLEYPGIDHYDALLPVRPTAENADFEFTGVEEGQGRLGKGSVTAGQDQATVPGWNSDSVPHVEELKEILQRFCEHRGAHVQVHDVDARTMQTAWNDRDATGTVLHTLLQAGLTYADAGMHHARRVADQWRGFYTACTQGEGRRLGADMPQMSRPLVEATATSEVAHKANQQKDTKAEAKNKQSPNHQSRGSKRKEQDSQATGLETVQAGTAPGGSKQAEPRPHDGPPIRRLRKKTAAAEVEHASVDNAEHRTVPEQLEETDESDTDVYPLYVWQPRHGNKDPRMERECAIRTAADLLSRTPTLPWNISTENATRQAYDLPSYHCAFCACSFVPDIRRTSKPFVEQACARSACCQRASACNTPQRDTSCISNISRDSELPLPAECTPCKLFFGSALLTSFSRKSERATRRSCRVFRLCAAVSIHRRLRPSANFVVASLRSQAASNTWARAGQA